MTVLQELLQKLGAHSQLIMYLTGPAGCGKSNVIKIAHQDLEIFCKECHLQFDPNSFLEFTTTGVAATQYDKGTTYHTGLELTSTTVSKNLQNKFKNANTIIINEISHTRLCNIAACNNTANCLLNYGGYNIIFTGGFAQLPPVFGFPLFSSHIDYWHGMIQKVIFLDNGHRFKDDPEWAKILRCIRLGLFTESDVIEINK